MFIDEFDEDRDEDEGRNDDDPVRTTVRTQQFIVGMLTGAVACFCLIVMATFRTAERRPGIAEGPTILGLPLVTATSVAACAVSALLALAASLLIGEAGLRAIARNPWPDGPQPSWREVDPADDEARLLALFQTRLIVASAFNEGAAFFGALAYTLDGGVVALAVVAASLILILFRFPTVNRVRARLDAQLDRLAALRR